MLEVQLLLPVVVVVVAVFSSLFELSSRVCKFEHKTHVIYVC